MAGKVDAEDSSTLGYFICHVDGFCKIFFSLVDGLLFSNVCNNGLIVSEPPIKNPIGRRKKLLGDKKHFLVKSLGQETCEQADVRQICFLYVLLSIQRAKYFHTSLYKLVMFRRLWKRNKVDHQSL